MNRKIGILLSYILMIIEVFSTLLLTPFIIRSLGQAEYGVYKLTIAINSYLLLLDLGVGNAVTKYTSQFRVNNNVEGVRKFLGISTLYYIFIGVTTIVIGGVMVILFPHAFAKGLTNEEINLGQKLLSFTVIGSVITLGTTSYANTIIAYERFYASKGSTIIFIICRMIITYISLHFGAGSLAIVIINLIITLFSRLFFVFYVHIKLNLKPIFRNIDFEFAKEVIVYSSLILLQMIATQLNASIGQMLIGSLVLNSAIIIGIYGVGIQIVQYYQSIGGAFSNILMPGVIRLVEQGADAKTLTNEMIRIGRIIFIILGIVWMGFWVLGQKFIMLWAGEDNRDAYFVSLLLMGGYLFIYVESIGIQILWAKNEHKDMSILKMMVVLVNIIITVFLIKWSPLKGATIGTFISLVLGDIGVLNYIFVKKIGIKIFEYYSGLFKGIFISIIGAGIVCKIISYYMLYSWFSFLFEIIILLIVYVVLLFAFGMNSYEKQLLMSIARGFAK